MITPCQHHNIMLKVLKFNNEHSASNVIWNYSLLEAKCSTLMISFNVKQGRERPFIATPRWKFSFLEPSLEIPISLVPIPMTLSFVSYSICQKLNRLYICTWYIYIYIKQCKSIFNTHLTSSKARINLHSKFLSFRTQPSYQLT